MTGGTTIRADVGGSGADPKQKTLKAFRKSRAELGKRTPPISWEAFLRATDLGWDDAQDSVGSRRGYRVSHHLRVKRPKGSTVSAQRQNAVHQQMRHVIFE